MSEAWSTSTRRARLPRDWRKRVAATRDRAAGYCEGISLDDEPTWHADGCNGLGRECDHDKRGDDHRLENLRWLSTPCHATKTQLEKPRRGRRARVHPSEGVGVTPRRPPQ